MRHSLTKKHNCARSRTSGCATSGDSVDDPSCPSMDMFRSVISKRKEGGVLHSMQGIGGPKKLVMMQFCVAEAVRFFQRQALREATVLATHTDSRGKRLTVAFVAGGPGLKTFRGTLGHTDYLKTAPIQPDKTTQLAQAFTEVVQGFCTQLKGAPGRPKAAVLDTELLQHIRNIHELFNADAEQTIQLCGDDLTGRLGDVVAPFLPNTHSCLKDHTHGCQRTEHC